MTDLLSKLRSSDRHGRSQERNLAERPVKVAHLTTVDSRLRYLLRPQLRAVRDRGGESIGISAPGPYADELEAEGIRHVPLGSSTRGMNLLADLRAAAELWRILRRERPDVLHTHNPKPGVYGRIVGRMVAEKGYPELFEAAARLDGRYVVAAIGPDDPAKPDALTAAQRDAAVRAGVVFLGQRDDVERLYAAMDVFVLPSHREGFPRAAMEAAATGLPIVATDVRGCRQVVVDGVTGLLVPVRNPARLAEAIASLGDDPERQQRMGVAAAGRARESFDERRVVDIVCSTYRDVAARRGLDVSLPALPESASARAAQPAQLEAPA